MGKWGQWIKYQKEKELLNRSHLSKSKVEIVPHNFFGSWNRSQKVFGEVELVPKYFWELE